MKNVLKRVTQKHRWALEMHGDLRLARVEGCRSTRLRHAVAYEPADGRRFVWSP